MSLCTLLLSFQYRVDATVKSTEDLLRPELQLPRTKTKDEEQLTTKSISEIDIDELLGPKDNFPFIPDNHRDSGSGKFNAY